MRCEIVTLTFLLGFVGAAQPMAAQRIAPQQCEEGVERPGRIQGRLVNESGGRVSGRGVSVGYDGEPQHCYASTDSVGHFVFEGLRAGRYLLEIAALGLASMAPIPIDLDVGDTVEFIVPVLVGNAVTECLMLGPCVAVLSHAAAGEEEAEPVEALQLLAYRLSIATGWGDLAAD